MVQTLYYFSSPPVRASSAPAAESQAFKSRTPFIMNFHLPRIRRGGTVSGGCSGSIKCWSATIILSSRPQDESGNERDYLACCGDFHVRHPPFRMFSISLSRCVKLRLRQRRARDIRFQNSCWMAAPPHRGNVDARPSMMLVVLTCDGCMVSSECCRTKSYRAATFKHKHINHH